MTNLKKTVKITSKTALFLLMASLLFSCKSNENHYFYQEKVSQSTLRKVPSQGNLNWVSPPNWVQESSTGMVTALFSLVFKNKFAEVSIVQLPGSGGDLPGNISRWMRQIKLVPFQNDEMNSFINELDSIKIGSGEEGLIVDLTKILSGNLTATKSTVGIIIPLKSSTLFVKLSGDKRVINAKKKEFFDFCNTIKAGV